MANKWASQMRGRKEMNDMLMREISGEVDGGKWGDEDS